MTDQISSFIHRKVVVLKQSEGVYAAARAMCENRIGCVIVSDEQGQLTGILSDRDVVCGLVAMNLSPDTTVAEIMSKDLVKVEERASIREVISLMKSHGIRRVAVVRPGRHGEKCVGIISLDDLLAAQSISIEDAARIAQSQIRRRERRYFYSAKELSHHPAEQDFARLINSFAARSDLTHEAARDLATLALSMIVRRLNYTLSARFIGLLPSQLHSSLFDLPAGPDLSLSSDQIVKTVVARFDMDPTEARKALRGLWGAIFEVADKARLSLIAEQLPDELRDLLVELTPGEGRGFGAEISPPTYG